MMKKLYYLFVLPIVGILSSCGRGNDRGEVKGVPQRSFRAEIPYGMVYIPGGSFLMGQTDQDVTFAQIAQNKQVTIAPFFMDQTELSNSQYKQFVNWVRDSIAITSYAGDEKYYLKPAKGATNSNGKKIINWDYVDR